ncbi:hypothetical protein KCP74_21495 [Salmonella enterica subsp. enterica]|nr:hypothetical protein KCP74_21495 [Salmonella enterica subsp. enterica]
MDYTDAVAILERCGKTHLKTRCSGASTSSEHERYLAEEHFQAPVVVKNYQRIKRFTCALTKMAKPWRPWMCWRRESSVVPSVKSVWMVAGCPFMAEMGAE